MKGLKITLTHGRVWTAETSDGKRATGATVQSAVGQLFPMRALVREDELNVLVTLFNGIRDSGNDGQFQQGRAGA